MRCPQCSQRNSVAAKKCTACGTGLRRKPLPLTSKIVVGTGAILVLVFCITSLSNALVNPDKALSDAATLLTSKSTSADQMLNNIKRLDQATRNFLQKYGSLSNEELSTKLSTCLPKSLYEDRVFELLPNLKLVEIDTALNASNYLVLLSNGKTEVLPIIGLDVYDSNSFLPQSKKASNDKKDNEGQLLVLLGHTANIHGHQPKVKVLLLSSTLQSDNIVDLTDTVVPKLLGEGTAKFTPNQKDIELSISLHSRGQEQGLFCPKQIKSALPVDNEMLYEQLIWQNNAYILRAQPGTSKLYALYAASSALKNHNKIGHFRTYLSLAARKTIEKASLVTSEQGFAIYRIGKKSTANNIYELKNDTTKAIVELRPVATERKGPGQNISWTVNSLTITRLAPVAIASAPIVEAKPETIKTPIPAEKPKAIGVKATEDHTPKPIAAPIQATPQTKIIEAPKKAEEIKPSKIESKVETKAETQPGEGKQATLETATKPQNAFVPDLTSHVKIRSGPGTSYKSVEDISPDTNIVITGKENGWYKVKVNTKEGYIYGGLVKNRSGGYLNKTIKQSCVVKDEQEKQIGNASRGEHLVILSGLKDNRYKVLLSNGKTGYINKEALEGDTAATNSNPLSATPSKPITKPIAKPVAKSIAKPSVKSTAKPKPKAKPAANSNTPPPFVP